MRRIVHIYALLIVTMICVACSNGQSVSTQTASSMTAAAASDNAATADVKIDNFTFEPQTLTVKAGTKITWTNRDDIPHTVVSTDIPPVFKSKPLDTDDKFTFTPTKPGTYPYFCSIHPKMTGKVVVE